MIATVTVNEEHVVIVGSRRMTITVYNQLVERVPEGPWQILGWVNRCPKDCQGVLGDHKHVLYHQFGVSQVYRYTLRNNQVPSSMHIPQLFIGA